MSEDTSLYRADAIYVSKITRLALSYLPRTDEAPNSDAWAEKVLSEWLKQNHPTVVAHLKTRFEDDKKFRLKYQSDHAAAPLLNQIESARVYHALEL